MGALVDTSVFVAVEKRESSAAWCNAALKRYDALYLNPMVLSELMPSVELAATAPLALARRATFDWAASLASLAVDHETALIHARMTVALKRRGATRWRQNGLWIAASAVQHGIDVLTCNGRDYEGIDGLTVACP